MRAAVGVPCTADDRPPHDALATQRRAPMTSPPLSAPHRAANPRHWRLRHPRQSLLREAWIGVVLFLWAACWGGLSFYALVVVPAGSTLHGSVEQGFVTQAVTRWHNGLLLGLVGCLAAEAWIRSSRALWWLVAVLGTVATALVLDHAWLSARMEFTERSVGPEFYRQHAVYLWITAAEWIVVAIVPFVVLGTSAGPAARPGPERSRAAMDGPAD